MLNSRLLCALSSDPSEFQVRSPSYFRIGRVLLAMPEYFNWFVQFRTEPMESRSTKVTAILETFERRLPTLITTATKKNYQKWFTNCRSLHLGILCWLIPMLHQVEASYNYKTTVWPRRRGSCICLKNPNGNYFMPCYKSNQDSTSANRTSLRAPPPYYVAPLPSTSHKTRIRSSVKKFTKIRKTIKEPRFKPKNYQKKMCSRIVLFPRPIHAVIGTGTRSGSEKSYWVFQLYQAVFFISNT